MIGLVVRQGMMLVAIGVILGVGMGMGAGIPLSSPPFAVPPPDFALVASAASLLAVIGALACYVPVRRTIAIRATDALRTE